MERLGPEAFEGRRLRRSGTWVVDFSADWCPFCQLFWPTFAVLDGDPAFRVAVGDLTDPDTPLWDLFEVEVTPTLIAFRDGAVVFRVDGRRGVGLDSADVRSIRAALAERPPTGPGPGGLRP